MTRTVAASRVLEAYEVMGTPNQATIAAAENLSASTYNYLEAIYSMLDEGKIVIGARLAERLRVTAPTVTAALKGLAKDGLITMTAQKEIRFTELGFKIALVIIRRHRLTERFLTDILGLEWHEAHEEATRFEHAMSPRVEVSVIRLLNNPTACPHGNPIPGLATRPPRNRMLLADGNTGDILHIERISEEAEIDPDLLAFLQQNSLIPGAILTIGDILKFNHTYSLSVAGRTEPVVVGEGVAELIWVVPDAEWDE